MADTAYFFGTHLPETLAKDPSLKSIGKTFLFDIAGAGKWTLDLANLVVKEGAPEGKADCTITSDKDSWDKVVSNPSSVMQLFMMGKIKADNLGLATQLQKILA